VPDLGIVEPIVPTLDFDADCVDEDLLITVGCCFCVGEELKCLFSCCAVPNLDPDLGGDDCISAGAAGAGAVAEPAAGAVEPPNGAVNAYLDRGLILERTDDFGMPVSPGFVETSQCKWGPEDFPVFPTVPSLVPAFTLSPTLNGVGLSM